MSKIGDLMIAKSNASAEADSAYDAHQSACERYNEASRALAASATLRASAIALEAQHESELLEASEALRATQTKMCNAMGASCVASDRLRAALRPASRKTRKTRR